MGSKRCLPLSDISTSNHLTVSTLGYWLGAGGLDAKAPGGERAAASTSHAINAIIEQAMVGGYMFVYGEGRVGVGGSVVQITASREPNDVMSYTNLTRSEIYLLL